MESTIQNRKVLLVITVFSIGGATETVVSVASGLKKRGLSVTIVTGPPLKNEGDMFQQADKEGIKVDVMNDMVRDINIIKDIVCLIKLTIQMRREKYDIVHTHSSKAGFIGRIAAWLAGVPMIVHTIHGLPYHDYQHPFWKFLYIYLEKIAALFCDRLICVSDAIIDNCVEKKISPQHKFRMIRSGFETRHFIETLAKREAVRKYYGFHDCDIVAGTISRLAPLKGHDHIIELAKITSDSLPQLKYFFVGDGESKQELQELVKANGLENTIIFSGLVQPQMIPEMISAMDFIIHLSLREGLARVLPQSIVMGKKVISYGLEGVQEVIKNTDGGFIVEPGDMRSLFDHCKNMVESNEMRHIPEAYRKMVISEFDSETMVTLHEKVYEMK